MDEKSKPPALLSLPSDLEIEIVRHFAAPPALVFETWTVVEHVKRWYPCADMTMPVCTIDLREGGPWRFVTRDAAGTEHALSGVYREIAPGTRLVFTEVYEPVPMSDHLVTLSFEAHGAGTRLVQRFRHTSKTSRDMHLQSGMESGIEATSKRMEEVLATLATR